MVYQFYQKQYLSYPLERVFSFFEKPENLNLITPPSLAFKILTPSPIAMQKDTRIDYRIRLYGIAMSWKTVISDYQPPYSFTDTQVKGPYKLWVHRHHFFAEGEGTIMIDDLQYALSMGVLGELAHRLFVRSEIKKIFEYRSRVIEQIFSESKF